MNILYVDFQMYGKEDIIDAFRVSGHDVYVSDAPLRYGEQSEEMKRHLSDELKVRHYDIVFTSNFYPVVSDLCEQVESWYISWTYDSPRIALYHPSIHNRHNLIFIFDSDECRRLQEKGVKRVYYLPLAVNPKRLSAIRIRQEDYNNFNAQVSLVASLYNESHNLYDRMQPKLSEYAKGYLEAGLQAQKNLFGGCVLEEMINKKEVLQDMYQAMPYQLGKGSLADLQYVYANYFLARKAASLQRQEMIEAIAQNYEIKVYTPGDISHIPEAKAMGTVDYQTDMNKVFQLSKINLNITLPSIHTGIPLRAMDIMGAGGFLLTNYQTDFDGAFVPDVDYVYYTSIEDALQKIAYYLEHEEERQQIAEHGCQTVREYHTYTIRIQYMLDILENMV